MPDKLSTSCKHCRQEYEVFPELQGQEFECDNCGNTYTVPNLSDLKVHRDSTGVYSPPEAHINAIKQLLHGYGNPFAILNEFIQNAEDAGSRTLHLLYVGGLDNAQRANR